MASHANYSTANNSHIEYDLSPGSPHYSRAYQLLSSLIVPRPIALISTYNSDGTINVAPYSYFNCMGSDPPLVAFSSALKNKAGDVKDTASNISRDKKFVVNLVDEAMAGAMNTCAAELPYGESELLYSKLTPALTNSNVSEMPPRLSETPASMECVEHSTLIIGSNRVVIGIVQRVHIRSDLVSGGEKPRILRDRLNMIGRMQTPGYYCKTRDSFLMLVPEAKALREEESRERPKNEE